MIVLFPFIGLWFWVYCLASFAMLCTCCYRERYTLATLDLLIFVGILSVTGYIPVIDLWQTIQTKPWTPVAWIAGYLLIGVVWARWKWRLLIRKLKAKFDVWRKGRTPEQIQADIEAANKLEDWDKRRHAQEAAALPFDLTRRGLILQDGRGKLDVANFKARITGWMSYWPISALIWVVGDFLADLFDQLYRMVRGHFQGMADREFDS